MSARSLAVLVLAAGCAGGTVPAQAQGVSAVRDAAGTLVGEYVEFRNGTVVHSVRGFRFLVDGSTAQVARIDIDIAGVVYDAELLYANFDCSGNVSIAVSGDPVAGGVVISGGTRGLYQVAKNAPAAVTLAASSWNGTACTAFTPGAFIAVPAAPNDPAVTGVPNAPFVAPIRLEAVPVSQFFQLFRDGFESSLLTEGGPFDAHA